MKRAIINISIVIYVLINSTTNFGIGAISHTKNDSLYHLYKSTTNSQIKLEALLLLSENEEDLLKAIKYSEEAILLAESLKLKTFKAKALNKSAVLWKNYGHYSIAAKKAEQAERIYTKTNNLHELNILKINIAEIYRAAEIYDKSVRILAEAIGYFETTNDTLHLSRAYNRLAAIYIELLHNKLEELTFCKNKILILQLNLEEIKKYPEPYLYYNIILHSNDKSLEFAKAIGNQDLIISNYIIKGYTYGITNQNLKSIEKYDFTIHYIDSLNLITDKALVLINLARLYGNTPVNNYEKAISLALEAKRIAKEENIKTYIVLSNEILHQNYLKVGDYQNAYFAIMENQELRKSFESEKLQLAILSNEFEKKINTKEFEIKLRKKINNILIIGTSIIILIFVIFITLLTKKNRRLGNLLNTLKSKNEIILKQKDSLEILSRDKDRIFSIIAHDLRNSVSGISGLSLILNKDFKNLDEVKIKKINNLIYSSSRAISDILENLLNWGKINFDRITFEPVAVSFHEIVILKVDLFEDALQKKDLKIEYYPKEDIIFHTDKEVLNIILRNFISNAIKFSYKGKKIEVNGSLQENEIKISVKDYGVGMSSEKANKLFSYSSYKSSQGTNQEIGVGLGLVLCKELIEKFDGKIWVESEEGKGSTFYITLRNFPPKTN